MKLVLTQMNVERIHNSSSQPLKLQMTEKQLGSLMFCFQTMVNISDLQLQGQDLVGSRHLGKMTFILPGNGTAG